MTPGTSLFIDYLMGVFSQFDPFGARERFQELLIESNIDCAVFGFAGPMRQSAGGEESDALRASLQGAAD